MDFPDVTQFISEMSHGSSFLAKMLSETRLHHQPHSAICCTTWEDTMADQKPPPPPEGQARERLDQKPPLLPEGQTRERLDTLPESMINLTLLDPARWGWTAAGGVADLLPPHEVRACFVKEDTALPGVF
jgi:hypothetical protein